jgi:hypothetical protein
MTTGLQPQPAARTMTEWCAIAELSDDGKQLLAPAHGPREYVALLVERELYPDAVKIIAHLLPRREGVWWAWVCARRVSGDDPPPAIRAVLDAVERWITHPTDENRRQAMQAAEVAQFSTAAGCAGLAAFFSGGSLAPPNSPPVPPDEFLTAKAITGAVVIAAVSTQPERAPEKFRAFIEQGLDVGARLQLWEARHA